MISQTQQMVYRLSNLDTQYEKNSYQMSTKKELQYGSDDSVLYARIVSVDDKIRTYEGLQSQIERTTLQNDTSDSSLSEIKKILEFAKQELIKANTATTTAAGIAAIASNISGIKENIFQLANSQVEGEYIFSGSDSSIRPFEKDATTGKVTYKGNNQLRQVAVEEDSYREKGVTGFDMMMYTSSKSSQGNGLTFQVTDRILDQSGNEWKLNSTNDALIKYDLNGNATTLGLKVTKSGNTITADTPSSLVFKATDKIVDKDGNQWKLDSTNSNLEKYDSSGNITSTKLSVTSSGGVFTSAVPSNMVDFDVKTNIFDLLDSTVNALKNSDAQSKTLISNSLGEFDKAFDAVNIAHADLGGKNQVFEISLERINSKLTQYNVLSEEISGADLTKVAMEAKALELTYTALYSTISKTNQLSLVNFLN